MSITDWGLLPFVEHHTRHRPRGILVPPGRHRVFSPIGAGILSDACVSVTGMPAEPASARLLAPMLLGSIDYVWSRVRGRIEGLSQDEYLFEPVVGCWSVRPAEHGVWRVDWVSPNPDPAPVTSMAWRLWHIGSECLAGYTSNGLGDWPLEVAGPDWYEHVDDALDALDKAWAAFRSGLDGLGEDGMWRELGDDWGPYAKDSWGSLVLHAQDEVSHHGAEVALLRDLYRARA